MQKKYDLIKSNPNFRAAFNLYRLTEILKSGKMLMR